MAGKKVVDVNSDAKGRTVSVRLQGNSTNTSLEAAVRMADKGLLEGVHAVHPQNGPAYIRSNPNGTVNDNLDTLAGDK